MDGIAAAAGVIPAFLIVGLIMAVTTRAAARGDIARTGLVGIRTRSTRRSDAAWRAGHQAAVRPSDWCAATCAGSAVVVVGLAIAGMEESSVMAAAAVGATFAILFMLLAVRRANAAAKRTQDV